MKSSILIISVIFYSTACLAQQPLSKKNQKRRAEFEAMIAAEEKYKGLRAKADQAFRNKDYANARMYYNQAIDFNKEDEQWLVSKVNDLDILMAEIVAREIDTISMMKIKEVATESAARNDNLPQLEARTIQMEVASVNREIDIDSTETVVKVEEPLKEPLKEKQQTVKESAANKPVNPKVKPAKPAEQDAPPKKEEKTADDYSSFPQGRTDQEFVSAEHTVRRIVIRDKRDVIVYKYVTHRWGGKFYFKDGVSIVERIWKQEVAAYEIKFPLNQANLQ